MKKLICIMLVIALVACMLCVPAFAAYTDPVVVGDEIIPNVDMDSSYSYWFVLRNYDGELELCFTDIPLYVVVENVKTSDNTSFECFSLNDDGSDWNGDVKRKEVPAGATYTYLDDLIASNYDILYADSDVPAFEKSEFKEVGGGTLSDTIDAVDVTLDTGLGMVNSVAETIASSPLLFICFAVGFVGIGVVLFKRIRK